MIITNIYAMKTNCILVHAEIQLQIHGYKSITKDSDEQNKLCL